MKRSWIQHVRGKTTRQARVGTVGTMHEELFGIDSLEVTLGRGVVLTAAVDGNLRAARVGKPLEGHRRSEDRAGEAMESVGISGGNASGAVRREARRALHEYARTGGPSQNRSSRPSAPPPSDSEEEIGPVSELQDADDSSNSMFDRINSAFPGARMVDPPPPTPH